MDFVAHGFSYEQFRDYFSESDYGKQQYAEVFSPDVQKRNLEQFYPSYGWGEKLVTVDHHLAHVASAFYPSGFPEALVLISDGMGEIHSMTVAVARENDF